MARGVDSMDGAAPACEWICELCEKTHSTDGPLCTECTVIVHGDAFLPPRPCPRIPEAQNSDPALSSSGVASADQTAARCTEEPTCLNAEERAPQRLSARSKARASNRIVEGRARPSRRPSPITTRRRSRSRSRADSMISEPQFSPVSARGGRGAVGSHGTAAIEGLLDLPLARPLRSGSRAEELPLLDLPLARPLRSGSRAEELPPSRRAPGPASRQPVSRLFEMLRTGLLGRHRADDRGQHAPGGEPDRREPESEPEPVTLRCESMRLI